MLVCRPHHQELLNLYDAIVTRIETLHPYQVPEIIATDITKCSPAYREWLLSHTRHTTEDL
jgi:uncharacterized protein involved in tolerance to divalent cations